LLVTIAVAYRYYNIVKFLVKDYSTNINNVEFYSFYTALQKKQFWQYLLNIETNINYKKENKIFLINII